jgi:bifunctional DNA-binding transcriptional regulator/antitoxin component of YhaV-PrlF toxin-antitoxin module
MVLLRRYRLGKNGHRGYGITLPREYIEDANLKPGQKMAMYRDEDRLLLVPEHKEEEKTLPKEIEAKNSESPHQEE